MEEGREFQFVGAAVQNEREPKDRSVPGTCIQAKEDDRNRALKMRDLKMTEKEKRGPRK